MSPGRPPIAKRDQGSTPPGYAMAMAMGGEAVFCRR